MTNELRQNATRVQLLKQLQHYLREAESLTKLLLNEEGIFEVAITENYIIEEIITYLNNIGIPSDILGYKYLKDAILMVVKEKSTKKIRITKEIYPVIAQKNDTNTSRVESAIRHAIEVAWNGKNIKLIDELFGNSISADKWRATNAQFVMTIADRVKRDLNLK